jgi:hypothetical protein
MIIIDIKIVGIDKGNTHAILGGCVGAGGISIGRLVAGGGVGDVIVMILYPWRTRVSRLSVRFTAITLTCYLKVSLLNSIWKMSEKATTVYRNKTVSKSL